MVHKKSSRTIREAILIIVTPKFLRVRQQSVRDAADVVYE